MNENQPFADLTTYLTPEDFKGVEVLSSEGEMVQATVGRQIPSSEDRKLAQMISAE